VTLRGKFANTIHLVHPNEHLPYIINTDASAKALGAVLLQQDREGNTNIPGVIKKFRDWVIENYNLLPMSKNI